MALTTSLKKLLQRIPPPITTTRILASLHNPKTSPFLPNFNNPCENSSSIAGRVPGSVSNSVKAENFDFTHLHWGAFSPVYPFGLCSDPVLPPGSARDGGGAEEGCSVDESGMWVDSVKKKRKKKMNKHKYKKLRKRIGRQT